MVNIKEPFQQYTDTHSQRLGVQEQLFSHWEAGQDLSLR